MELKSNPPKNIDNRLKIAKDLFLECQSSYEKRACIDSASEQEEGPYRNAPRQR